MSSSTTYGQAGLTRARTAISLAVVLILNGCGANQEFKQAPDSRYVKTIPEQAAEPPAIAAPVVIPKAPAVREVPKPERQYPEPTVLDGLAAAQVETLLGVPGFKRNDDPAEIWQYRVNSCTLDLFMYETLDSSQRSVAHYEARPKPDAPINIRDCFIDVIKAGEAQAKTPL